MNNDDLDALDASSLSTPTVRRLIAVIRTCRTNQQATWKTCDNALTECITLRSRLAESEKTIEDARLTIGCYKFELESVRARLAAAEKVIEAAKKARRTVHDGYAYIEIDTTLTEYDTYQFDAQLGGL